MLSLVSSPVAMETYKGFRLQEKSPSFERELERMVYNLISKAGCYAASPSIVGLLEWIAMAS